MPSSIATSRSLPSSSERPATVSAVRCRGVVKRFYRYEHRTTSLREFFVRAVTRRPQYRRSAEFSLMGFDLTVGCGEAVALIGPNGSGKSTALRLIAGIYAPSEGVVETAGRVTAVIELGSGFHPELTGAENVRLYGALLGFDPAALASRQAAITAFADIGGFIDEPVKYYSSGMQARLAFSVAVCADPDVLLLDEALAVGDQAFRDRCLARLRELREAGKTLVVASHDPVMVRTLCDRAVWLDHGRVRMMGPVHDVLAAYEADTRRSQERP